ncbi:hypothetical protein ADEAN_000019000 [Angomonas deanei]|uniref:Uncharacterized protein n=1 Tax=Angomonas deanei TaxID=59799 RepID=A0A7G2BZ51_9TRYP|nr:hypothetical protein ADEAN_000019000 [Angomonas deanei]
MTLPEEAILTAASQESTSLYTDYFKYFQAARIENTCNTYINNLCMLLSQTSRLFFYDPLDTNLSYRSSAILSGRRVANHTPHYSPFPPSNDSFSRSGGGLGESPQASASWSVAGATQNEMLNNSLLLNTTQVYSNPCGPESEDVHQSKKNTKEEDADVKVFHTYFEKPVSDSINHSILSYVGKDSILSCMRARLSEEYHRHRWDTRNINNKPMDRHQREMNGKTYYSPWFNRTRELTVIRNLIGRRTASPPHPERSARLGEKTTDASPQVEEGKREPARPEKPTPTTAPKHSSKDNSSEDYTTPRHPNPSGKLSLNSNSLIGRQEYTLPQSMQGHSRNEKKEQPKRNESAAENSEKKADPPQDAKDEKKKRQASFKIDPKVEENPEKPPKKDTPPDAVSSIPITVDLVRDNITGTSMKTNLKRTPSSFYTSSTNYSEYLNTQRRSRYDQKRGGRDASQRQNGSGRSDEEVEEEEEDSLFDTVPSIRGCESNLYSDPLGDGKHGKQGEETSSQRSGPEKRDGHGNCRHRHDNDADDESNYKSQEDEEDSESHVSVILEEGEGDSLEYDFVEHNKNKVYKNNVNKNPTEDYNYGYGRFMNKRYYLNYEKKITVEDVLEGAPAGDEETGSRGRKSRKGRSSMSPITSEGSAPNSNRKSSPTKGKDAWAAFNPIPGDISSGASVKVDADKAKEQCGMPRVSNASNQSLLSYDVFNASHYSSNSLDTNNVSPNTPALPSPGGRRTSDEVPSRPQKSSNSSTHSHEGRHEEEYVQVSRQDSGESSLVGAGETQKPGDAILQEMALLSLQRQSFSRDQIYSDQTDSSKGGELSDGKKSDLCRLSARGSSEQPLVQNSNSTSSADNVSTRRNMSTPDAGPRLNTVSSGNDLNIELILSEEDSMNSEKRRSVLERDSLFSNTPHHVPPKRRRRSASTDLFFSSGNVPPHALSSGYNDSYSVLYDYSSTDAKSAHRPGKFDNSSSSNADSRAPVPNENSKTLLDTANRFFTEKGSEDRSRTSAEVSSEVVEEGCSGKNYSTTTLSSSTRGLNTTTCDEGTEKGETPAEQPLSEERKPLPPPDTAPKEESFNEEFNRTVYSKTSHSDNEEEARNLLQQVHAAMSSMIKQAPLDLTGDSLAEKKGPLNMIAVTKLPAALQVTAEQPAESPNTAKTEEPVQALHAEEVETAAVGTPNTTEVAAMVSDTATPNNQPVDPKILSSLELTPAEKKKRLLLHSVRFDPSSSSSSYSNQTESIRGANHRDLTSSSFTFLSGDPLSFYSVPPNSSLTDEANTLSEGSTASHSTPKKSRNRMSNAGASRRIESTSHHPHRHKARANSANAVDRKKEVLSPEEKSLAEFKCFKMDDSDSELQDIHEKSKRRSKDGNTSDANDSLNMRQSGKFGRYCDSRNSDGPRVLSPLEFQHGVKVNIHSPMDFPIVRNSGQKSTSREEPPVKKNSVGERSETEKKSIEISAVTGDLDALQHTREPSVAGEETVAPLDHVSSHTAASSASFSSNNFVSDNTSSACNTDVNQSSSTGKALGDDREDESASQKVGSTASESVFGSPNESEKTSFEVGLETLNTISSKTGTTSEDEKRGMLDSTTLRSSSARRESMRDNSWGSEEELVRPQSRRRSYKSPTSHFREPGSSREGEMDSSNSLHRRSPKSSPANFEVPRFSMGMFLPPHQSQTGGEPRERHGAPKGERNPLSRQELLSNSTSNTTSPASSPSLDTYQTTPQYDFNRTYVTGLDVSLSMPSTNMATSLMNSVTNSVGGSAFSRAFYSSAVPSLHSPMSGSQDVTSGFGSPTARPSLTIGGTAPLPQASRTVSARTSFANSSQGGPHHPYADSSTNYPSVNTSRSASLRSSIPTRRPSGLSSSTLAATVPDEYYYYRVRRDSGLRPSMDASTGKYLKSSYFN